MIRFGDGHAMLDRAAIKLLHPLRIMGTPSIGVPLENLENGHGTCRNLPSYPGVIHDGWDFAQRFDRSQSLDDALPLSDSERWLPHALFAYQELLLRKRIKQNTCF
jgi:hypothetical protein